MRLVHDNGNEVFIRVDGGEITRQYFCDGEQQGSDTLTQDSAEDAAEYVRQYVLDLKSDGYRDVGGRPKVGKLINVRLPRDVVEAVDAIATTEGTSRAQVMRRLLTSGEHV